MLFNSLEFLLFALCFLAIFPFARKKASLQHLAITVFSWFFYAYGDLNFLPLLVLIGTFNYTIGNLIVRKSKESIPFYIAIAGNLLFLFWGKFHLSQDGHLPLGISFYVFQAMSYLIDVQRKKAPLAQNFLHFQAYLFFFPQLIAGPICRAEELLEQIRNPLSPPSKDMVRRGIYLFSYGLFKKVTIADALANRIDPIFSEFHYVQDAYSWVIIIISFGWQIYFDFSGYTDMARGISKILGVNLPENFNFPYFAKSPQNFWQRWHITLSEWFRDYVYIPLGGSKKGTSKFILAIFTTFLLSSLWHGIGSNYVLWGLWHATWIIVFQFYFKDLPLFWSRCGTLMVVFSGWIFFRCREPGQLLHIFNSLGNFKQGSILMLWNNYNDLILLCLLALSTDAIGFWLKRNYKAIKTEFADILWVILTLSAMVLQTPVKSFIYFRF